MGPTLKDFGKKLTLRVLGKRIAYQYTFASDSIAGFPAGLTAYYFNARSDAELFLSYIPQDKRGRWTQYNVMATPSQYRVDVKA